MNLEIEFKYNAEDIKLNDFMNLCERKNPVGQMVSVSGTDHFYANDQLPNSFFRVRDSDGFKEFTYKRKTEESNNFVRVEYNFDMGFLTKTSTLEAFMGEFAYEYKFKLFKISHIFTFETYKAAYYICYDEDSKELGRFIEIEMKEDYEWASKEEAWGCLIMLEKSFKTLGIKPAHRIKESLFEIFAPELSVK